VRVGMPRSMGEILAVKLLQEARRRAPAMSVRIVEHFSESLYALLLERELDIALTYSTENSVRVVAELISLQRLSLISPVNSDLPSTDQIALSSAMELPLILGSPPHVVRKLLTAAAMENGTLPNVVHEMDSLQTTLSMVEGGLGHTVLPATLAAKAAQEGLVEVRTIVSPEVTRKLHLVRPAQSAPTRAQLLVRNLLMELLQQLPPATREARYHDAVS
jgi:DNA-binding transcriptional LysR family regulator